MLCSSSHDDGPTRVVLNRGVLMFRCLRLWLIDGSPALSRWHHLEPDWAVLAKICISQVVFPQCCKFHLVWMSNLFVPVFTTAVHQQTVVFQKVFEAKIFLRVVVLFFLLKMNLLYNTVSFSLSSGLFRVTCAQTCVFTLGYFIAWTDFQISDLLFTLWLLLLASKVLWGFPPLFFGCLTLSFFFIQQYYQCSVVLYSLILKHILTVTDICVA